MSKKRRLKLKNDVAFKAVFGREDSDCKKALMLLLNRLLARTEDPIVSIRYMNPFNVREEPNDKESVMDIKVRTETGEQIDIEMQLYFEEDFIDRSVHYTSGMVFKSVDKGSDYDILKTCISIYLLDFTLFADREAYHTVFQLRTDDEFRLTEKIEMHYIELPKVNPKGLEPEQLTGEQRLLEYLRCAGEEEQEDYVEALLRQGDKEVHMAEEMLGKVTEEEILYEKALAREKFLWQQASFRRGKEKAEAELSKTEAELSKTEAELSKTEAELSKTEAELSKAEAELSKAEAERNEAVARLEKVKAEVEAGQAKAKAEREEAVDETKASIAENLRQRGMSESEIRDILQGDSV